MKAGFVGLGSLGRAMAERLISQGVELTVWNRTAGKASGLKATVAGSPSEVIDKNEIVFLNLFDSEAVGEIISSDHGLLGGCKAGKIIVDTTTNHFDAVPTFYDIIESTGAAYLEAPIFGSVVPATKGALTIVVSGPRKAFQTVGGFLDLLAAHVFHLPDPTMATRMKLINNLCLGSFMATIAEALIHAEANGIKANKALEILGVGGGSSGVLAAKTGKLLSKDFAPHFSVNAIYKDLHYLQDMARNSKTPSMMGAMAREIFAMARARGMDEDDFSVVYKLLSEFTQDK